MNEYQILAVVGWLALAAFACGALGALAAVRRLRPALQAEAEPERRSGLRRRIRITGRQMGAEGARGER